MQYEDMTLDNQSPSFKRQYKCYFRGLRYFKSLLIKVMQLSQKTHAIMLLCMHMCKDMSRGLKRAS